MLALLPAAGGAVSNAKQDVTIAMDDGVGIAATLYTPAGAAPAGGWPAIVFLHGLSGNRGQMNTLAESYGFVGQDYAVLTFDARGHGASGGLVGIDGPREVADTRAVFNWLRARPDVRTRRSARWGISYGGGAIWNSLAAGVPWAAVEVAETWTDLYSALVPSGLVKSGLVAGLSGSIPAERRSPELDPVQAAAFSGTNFGIVRAFSTARSSIAKLGNVKTPVFMMQGRRDFLFGIDQALTRLREAEGPEATVDRQPRSRALVVPGRDTQRRCSVRDACGSTASCAAQRTASTGDPPWSWRARGRARVSRSRASRPSPPSHRRSSKPRLQGPKVDGVLAARTTAKVEVFGAPVVSVTATTTGGWSRLVAVLTARTPAGKEILVAAGGVPARDGTRTYTIRLGDQATLIPKGSRLTVTLGSSTLAQSPGNILYLELPMPAGARIAAVDARHCVALPALAKPVS